MPENYVLQQPVFIKGDGFLVEVIRTGRQKTASVRVRAGKVSVAIPRSLPDSHIEALVARKTRWIRKMLLQQENAEPVEPREYVSGESFTYLGRNYRLMVESGNPVSVKLRQGSLWVRVPDGCSNPEKVRKALTQWFRTHADQKLREKTERYARVIGVSPSAIAIKTFKSRWGSCDSRGLVKFNWKLIVAPNRIVDYVVVHELCHLKQHNHSPRFWKCVESVFPDYRECREWLKLNGGILEV
jgi:predicted metal-dependent hydrolase